MGTIYGLSISLNCKYSFKLVTHANISALNGRELLISWDQDIHK